MIRYVMWYFMRYVMCDSVWYDTLCDISFDTWCRMLYDTLFAMFSMFYRTVRYAIWIRYSILYCIWYGMRDFIRYVIPYIVLYTVWYVMRYVFSYEIRYVICDTVSTEQVSVSCGSVFLIYSYNKWKRHDVVIST